MKRLRSFRVLKLLLCAGAVLGAGLGMFPASAQDNQPPQLAPIANQTINEGSLLVFNCSATDPDIPAQTLIFSLEFGAPEGAAMTTGGVFSWTPTETQGPGVYTLRAIVNDSGTPSLSATQTFTVTVQEVNLAPTLGAIADRTISEGTLLTFTASATDPDLPAHTLTYTLGGTPPAGASIDPVSGVFTWTPSELQGPGTFFISVFVTDNGTPALNDARGFLVTVQEVNRPPEWPALADVTADEGTFIGLSVAPTDPDVPAQTLTITLGADAPAGAAVSSGGFFSWSPTEAQGPSSNRVTLIATDNGAPNLSSTQFFNVIIREANLAPSLGFIADQTINGGSLMTFTATATDPDLPPQLLTFSLSAGAPAGAAIHAASGVFTWTPTANQSPSTNRISVIVTDNGVSSLSATQSFLATVLNFNAAPSLAVIPDQTIDEGTLLTFTASATDSDQPPQTLTFSLGAGAPAGAAIDPATGVFSWTPDETQGPGTNLISVVVTDNGSPPASAARSFTVVINEVNRPPVIPPLDDRATSSGNQLVFTVSATDPDVPAQSLTYSLGAGAPAGAAISVGGVFTWTPTPAQSPSTNAIDVIVTDNGTPGLSATRRFTAIVTDLNRAPSVNVIPEQTVNEGSLLTFTATATDSDLPPQTLTFSLGAGAPEGAVIDANTGVFTWTPAENQGPGTNFLNVIVTDNGTPVLSGARGFTVVVSEVNRPPEIDPIADHAANANGLLIFGVSFRDPDIPAQTVTLSLGAGAPAGADISQGGLFTWTPTPAQAPSTNTITVIASDGALTATRSFIVTVQGINHAPTLDVITDRTVDEGTLLTLTATASDQEQPLQSLTFTLGAGAPEGAAIDANTGVFTWTPAENQGPATNLINVVVTDNGTPPLSTARGFTVVVNEVNRPPEIDPIADQPANANGLLIVGVGFRDPDIPAQTVTLSLGAGAPAGAAISQGGLFTWTPTPAQAPSTNTITVIASDGALTATRSFIVTVQGINHAPVLDVIADQTVNEGELLTLTITASDQEQPLQTLTFTLGAGAPEGVALNPSTGVFTWTPTEIQGPFTNVFGVIVMDNGTPPLSAARSFTVVVNEVNSAPEIDPIADQLVNVDGLLVFGVGFRDPDIPHPALNLSLGPGAPAGAEISQGGLFTWTPTLAQAGTTNVITITVSDGALSASRSFTVRVQGVNRLPVLNPIPDQTVDEGMLLTFTATASDPDQPGQSLTFALGAGAPDGAAIDPATGVFTWTPSEPQGPSTNIFGIVVTDNGTPALGAARSFTVVVNEVNRPPEIDPITNHTAVVGGLLIFNVTFRDPDLPGQTLTLGLAAGAPAGAEINPSGLFTWTPAIADASTTNTITVTLTDGSLTATRSFTVTVGAFNRPPVIDPIPDRTVNEGTLLTFAITATDPDQPAQSLTYALGAGAPAGASLNPTTGVFTWTPNELEGPETNGFSVLVTDNGTPPLSVSGSFRIVVNEVNQPPFFLPDTNLIVAVGSPLIIDVEADDLDIPFTVLTYSLGPGAPGGAFITPRGEFSWRPAAGQGPSNYFVTVIVADGGAPVLRATNVLEINVIVGTPIVSPILRNPVWSNNVFETTLDMQAGRRYSLEASDPNEPLNWRTVEAFSGRGAPDTMTDRTATNRNRIYRARVE
jgi:hypothetical protein